MNNRSFLLMLVLFSFCCLDTDAQIVLADKSKNRYLVDNHFYHYRDLGSFFESDAEQKELYEESIYQLNQTRNANYVACGALTIGLAAWVVDSTPNGSCGLFCISDGQTIFILGVLSLPLVAIIGVNSRFSYVEKKKQLLDMYNGKFDSSSLSRIHTRDYSFSPSTQGIGIAMNF